MGNKILLSTCLAALVAICFAASVSKNFSQVGDVKISYDGKTLQCDSITCPDTAVLCVVTKKSIGNKSEEIERHARCFDESENVVLEKKSTEPNPKPGMSVNVHVESGINGTLSSTSEEIVKNITQEVNDQIKKIHDNMKNGGWFPNFIDWFNF